MVYSFKKVQLIPTSLESAWNFFATPVNLVQITPADMGFKLKAGFITDKMYAGQLIEYTVKPLFGIPLYWMTEITHMQDQKYFAMNNVMALTVYGTTNIILKKYPAAWK